MLNPSLQSLADVLVNIAVRQLVDQRSMVSEDENCGDISDLKAVARDHAQAETLEVQL